ncbi:FosX/FosE/FosI family fosfomycin resistance hydrolase [Pararhizobium sp. IMCC21322]|uniref:FosX/FosE/FosI family fosfomycin resistance hydrolase n=1 Tax=Pararhizobium sp. IMCC21322 TaxID=3067903 RepID=UPI002740E417|nr:FosX/FosE/FosI family fosfomycin resistance hydrolase [Pararhizobium sp. IMCC21322]
MSALSHITFIVQDLDRMQIILEQVLKAKCIYASGQNTFSLSEERFFLVDDVWIGVMKGDSLSDRSYNHIAFKIEDTDFDDRLAEINALGLEIRPPRPRVEGEGRSIYFYDNDNHLLELHTGTLKQRLEHYGVKDAY